MGILFKMKKFQKECNKQKTLIRVYGQRRAKLIRRRLDELMAATTIEDIRRLPGPRCHELKGNRSGQLSVNLDYLYRLIFGPANDDEFVKSQEFNYFVIPADPGSSPGGIQYFQ